MPKYARWPDAGIWFTENCSSGSGGRRVRLSQQAGRALAKLYRIAESNGAAHRPSLSAGGIVIYSIVKPELDLHQLAQILVEIAQHLDDAPPEPGQVDDLLAS